MFQSIFLFIEEKEISLRFRNIKTFETSQRLKNMNLLHLLNRNNLKRSAWNETTTGSAQRLEFFRSGCFLQNAFTVPGEMITSVTIQAFLTALIDMAIHHVNVSNVTGNEIALILPQDEAVVGLAPGRYGHRRQRHNGE